MNAQIDTEDFIGEFDEGGTGGSGNGGGAKIAIIILSLLVVAAGGAAAMFGTWWSADQKAVLEAETQLKSLNEQISQLETARSDLSTQLAEKQAELERIRTESATRIAELEKEHRETVQKTYAQMDEIVYDSRKTLEYIGTIEDKLKTGKALDEEEAGKLRTVVTGLTFLHEQYEKPIHEFRELERFLTDQLNVPRSVPPAERYGLLKRIFKNREFKAEQASFFQEEGQRQAFVRARTKVSEAYSRAQSQMKSLKLDSSKFLNQLDTIVESNEGQVAEVDDFFEKSKEILKIHDRIMKLEPDQDLQPSTKP
ncbi:MAG: hypothetical protein HKN23_00440 [Verrucomicrobiales bacterium]|nr:hypothetical protein [Verrucomicrobiales bacterium]